MLIEHHELMLDMLILIKASAPVIVLAILAYLFVDRFPLFNRLEFETTQRAQHQATPLDKAGGFTHLYRPINTDTLAFYIQNIAKHDDPEQRCDKCG